MGETAHATLLANALARKRSGHRSTSHTDEPRIDLGLVRWLLGERRVCTSVAVEAVLADAIGLLEGARPVPGESEFDSLRRLAEVLRTLDDHQRGCVRGLLVDLARGAMYWPMVKLANLPSATLASTLVPRNAHERDLAPVSIDDMQAHFHEWLAAFADTLGEADRR